MITIAELPSPVWPVVVLAVISLGDAIMCVRPVKFIEQCFADVAWPREFWWMMAPIKTLAAVALIAGIWVPWLATAASFALVAYFVAAMAMHVRAKDFGRNFFVNSIGMFAICVAVAIISFVGTG